MIPESDIYHHKMTLSIQNRHSKKNYIQFIYLDIFFLIEKKTTYSLTRKMTNWKFLSHTEY